MQDRVERFSIAQDGRSLQRTLDHIAATTADEMALPGGAAVAFWNPIRQAFVAGSSTVPTQRRGGAFVKLRPDGMSRWLVDNGRELVVDDIDTHQTPSNAMLADAGNRTYIGVRLEGKEGSLGVLYGMDQHNGSLAKSLQRLKDIGKDASALLDAQWPVASAAALNVLVVEDDSVLRDAIARSLRSLAQVNVEQAATRREAIDAAKAIPPDFMILDIQLGHESGYELGHTINEQLPFHDIDIWMITGNPRVVDPGLNDLIGAKGTLPKPFGRQELRTIVEAARDRRLPT